MSAAPPAAAVIRRNATQRPLLRRWLVGGALLVLLLFGAILLAAAIGMEVGVQVGLLATVIAVLPVGIVVPAFLWLDRHEAEPTSSLLVAFGWGAFVATAFALVLNTGSVVLLSQIVLEPEVVATVVVAPVVEEIGKGFGILVVLWLRRHEFDGLIDGVVYGGIVAAGFAFAENILYLGRALVEGGTTGLVVTLVLRGLFGPFAHPLFTVWMGIGIGVMASRRWGPLRFLAPVLGLVAAIVLHALWNGSAVASFEGWLTGYFLVQVPIFVATIAFVVWARRREGVLIARHLGGYARRGLFTPAEVTMLSSLSQRRAAREWAGRARGRAGRAAMRDLQDDAVELAFLADRREHGTAGRDVVRQEQHLIDSILRCRASLA